MKTYKKQQYPQTDRSQIQYTIQKGPKTFEYPGNNLYRMLLDRQDSLTRTQLMFKILRKDLPEYVWDNLYMQIAAVEVTEPYLCISEDGLRQFLNEMDYQYFNPKTAAEFASFQATQLQTLTQRILVNGHEQL